MTAARSAAVAVPASSANLGPGFDSLGLAIELRDVYRFEPATFDQIEATGKFPEHVPRDVRRNLAFRAFRSIAPVDAGHYRLRAHRMIPPQGGLGSSGSAIVGGLVAANLAFDLDVPVPELLRRAAEIEGHPDNVAPSLLGGLVVTVQTDGDVRSVRVPFPKALSIVLVVPDYRVPTYRARQVLPTTVPRGDAVANVGRVALLLAALQAGDYEVLKIATQDFLHQPYRAGLNPALGPSSAAAMEAGAFGTALSGSGPTIIGFAPRERVISVAGAMADACIDAGHACESYVVGPADVGARPAEPRDEA